MSEETFYKFVRGEAPLTLQGKLAYSDVFGIPHTTECKGHFEVKSQTFRIDENKAD
jgi:hypothetical protein